MSNPRFPYSKVAVIGRGGLLRILEDVHTFLWTFREFCRHSRSLEDVHAVLCNNPKFFLICKKDATNRISASFGIWKGEDRLPFPV